MMDLLYSDPSSDEMEGQKGIVGEVYAQQKGKTLLLRVAQQAKYIYAIRPGEPERVFRGPFPQNTEVAIVIDSIPAGTYTLYAGDIDEEIVAYGTIAIT